MSLRNSFPQVTEKRWREMAQRALRSGDLERLSSVGEDGFPIAPIYPRAAGPRPLLSGARWRVIARVDHPDARQANDSVLDDLTNGADGLQLIFAGAGGAYGYGLAQWSEAALRDCLEGVDFDAGLSIDCDLGPPAAEQALAVGALVARASHSVATVDLSFGLDPLGALARSGRANAGWPEMAAATRQTAILLRDLGFNGPLIVADGRCVHDAGGSSAQELGYSLACAIDYLRALSGQELALEAARDCIAFRLAADCDEYLCLSKFRALRLLWARSLEACDLAPNRARVHGASAWRMMSARDPWVNVMRGALAAFCAGLGGADSVSVLPFTQPIGLPDAFARRLARNAQLLMLEESHLGFVGDPAAGAGAFEALTEQLCMKAWAFFQAIEARGGVYAALAAGEIQAEVGRTCAARADRIASREFAITGVSEFANLGETAVTTLPSAGPSFQYAGEKLVTPLLPGRLSEPFEALRDKSDVIRKQAGSAPKVFLATIGAVGDFGVHATFAKSLFEAGGFETIETGAAANADEAARYFVASRAALACLCASDKVYANQGVSTALALRASGARMIALAGPPGQGEAALRAAGVDLFIHAGGDALAGLALAYKRLG